MTVGRNRKCALKPNDSWTEQKMCAKHSIVNSVVDAKPTLTPPDRFDFCLSRQR
jgi:hypothetical protein